MKVIADRQAQNVSVEKATTADGAKVRLALIDLLIDMQRKGEMTPIDIRNQSV